MHRWTASLVLGVLAGVYVVAPAAASVDDATSPYIVVFRDSSVAVAGSPASHPHVDASRVGALVDTLGQRAGISPSNIYTHVFGGFSARLSAGQLRVVQSNRDVASVTPDSTVSLQEDETGANATEVLTKLGSPKVPAGVKRIGATQSAIASIGGDGGKVNADVAVIDTGIQRDHPDLNVVGGYNCTTSNRGAWDDGNGHGTHVAGIIAAQDNGQGVVGVAPGARLWAIKVLDSTGNGLLSWIVCGVDWITQQRVGTNGSRPLIDVANMSLRSNLSQGDDGNCGRTARDTLHQAMCRSVAAGTVYVVAAGNDRNDARYYRPAAYDEAITVSAMTDYDGKAGGLGSRPSDCPAGYPDDTWAGFSNFGNDVDLTAPGVCVLSTWAGSQYAWASGTSMAAPYVTGAAALYKVAYPSAQPQQVKMALQYAAHTDWKRSTDPDSHPDLMVWATDFSAPPDFDVSASAPSSYSGLGETVNISVSLDRRRGHTAPIALSISGLPSSFDAADVTTTGSSATVQVRIGPYASSGRYTATVTADDGELVHSAAVEIRVDGQPPVAKFGAPSSNRIQTSKSQKVSWTESDSGGSGIDGRVLWRQRAAPVVPGVCTGLTYYNVGFPRTAHLDYIDSMYNGFCYRWSVTVRDNAGNYTTTFSPTVLVDTTAPDKPDVTVAASSSSTAYVDGSGTLWLRGGGSGSVDLYIAGNDPTSGVTSISLSPTTSTTGWTFPRTITGDAGKAHFTYTSKAVPLAVNVRARNGAGLTSYPTSFKTAIDGTAPTSSSWSAPSTGFWYSPDGEVSLRWSAGSDSGSGLATSDYLRRQRAPTTSSGGCGTWSNESVRYLSSGYLETGLLSGYCYRWQVRNTDRVGNLATATTSGTVLVDKIAPKVSIEKPLPGATVIKSKTTQTVSWSASDSGGSKMASVTVQRQRATSHPSGTCSGATWKADGSVRSVASPLYESGLVAGSCYRWIVTASDKATNVTSAYTGPILISGAATASVDSGSTAPSVGSLAVVPWVDDRLTASDMVRLNATWTAAGGSGSLAGFEVQISSSGGSTWSTYTSPNGATPQMTLQLPAGHTYMVEVRAHNSLGAWSDWSAPATFAVGMAEGEVGVGYQKAGSWKSAALSGASGGAVTYSSTSTDILRYSFTGRSVALISTLGPDRGTFDVYIDGYRQTTVNLYSATLTTRQVVFVRNWASSGAHVISLQLRSPSRVDVDACVVLN